MDCPHCQAPLPEPPPRFCDACGLSTGVGRVPAKAAKAANKDEVRCQECGLLATARRCRGCGARVRWPDGVVPPDEAR